MSIPLESTVPFRTACPERGTLLRFLMGQLDEADVESVSSHLDGCELCRTSVESFPADDLLKALRQPDPCTIDATPWRMIVQRLENLPHGRLICRNGIMAQNTKRLSWFEASHEWLAVVGPGG